MCRRFCGAYPSMSDRQGDKSMYLRPSETQKIEEPLLMNSSRFHGRLQDIKSVLRSAVEEETSKASF
jgi:hypothetical protein